MENTELTLHLKPGFVKKLQVIAMLTGRTFDQVESDLSESFDSMLSQTILGYLAELDGGDVKGYASALVPRAAERESAPVRRTAPRSFAQAEAQANDVLNTGVEDTVEGEHSLSGDDDLGENKSLEEQAADGTLTAADIPLALDIPDAGEDAEAFVELAMSSEKTHLPANQRDPVKRASSLSFNASRPRVSIVDA